MPSPACAGSSNRVEAGLSLCVDTDAHSPGQLSFTRYGIAVARRGWLEMNDVLNTLRLDQPLARRRRPQARAA